MTEETQLMIDELRGRTILITRSSAQASNFRELLEGMGATVIETPTIEIRPRMSAELDKAIEDLSSYDWLMLTSANSVRIFFERASELGRLPLPDGLPRICTIGPATARSVAEFNLTVDLVPRLYQAEGVIEEFLELHQGQIKGVKILLPRASKARDILPEELRLQGATVDLIPVYDTVLPDEGRARLHEVLAGPLPDLVTFTSSSTVHNFVALADDDSILQRLNCAVIGPITAATAEDYGLKIVLQPQKFTIPDLAEAIRNHFGK